MTAHPKKVSPVWRLAICFSAICFWIGAAAPASPSNEGENVPAGIEVVRHAWRPDAVWERIGKTKFIWSATVRNRSGARKRVFVYYDLLDDLERPLASNVANRTVEPGQTVDVVSDSYINSDLLPKVKSSRVTVKLGFPN